jgi:hypothetical protein
MIKFRVLLGCVCILIIPEKVRGNSVNGTESFETDVFILKPDELLIDFTLNDRSVELEKE